MEAPRTLWHASRAQVACPTIDGRTDGGHHANSGLGLFCATAPHDYIANFGETIHALEIIPGARVLRMDVQALASMGRPSGQDPERTRQWFEEEGRRLSRDYDLVEIVEANGEARQAIVLNDAAIVSSRAMDRQAFLAGPARPMPPVWGKPR